MRVGGARDQKDNECEDQRHAGKSRGRDMSVLSSSCFCGCWSKEESSTLVPRMLMVHIML
jgi:hypothetical protein